MRGHLQKRLYHDDDDDAYCWRYCLSFHVKSALMRLPKSRHSQSQRREASRRRIYLSAKMASRAAGLHRIARRLLALFTMR